MTSDIENDDQAGLAEEVLTLLNSLAQDDLNDVHRARLCALLAESEEARWAFLHAVHLGEGIKQWSRTQAAADVWAVVDLLRESDDTQDNELAAELEHLAMDEALQSRESADGRANEVTPRAVIQAGASSGGGALIGQRAAMALAASLLVALALWQVVPRQRDATTPGADTLAINGVPAVKTMYALSDSENVVARVTSATNDLSWSRGQEPQDFLMRFRPGDVFGIEQGLVQLEFSAGALLIVESPAMLQVMSANSARLIQGRVVGRADNGNFTLLTPTANVVDIGTEFGVGVSHSGTDVTVFEGEVHVLPLLGSVDSDSVQKLQRGMSVWIDSHGLTNSRRQTNQERFQRGFVRPVDATHEEDSVSLLDLISGDDTTQQRIAGSIDPQTGYWGRPPWLDSQRSQAQRGDTQFAQTDWNPMVDGVFIPRSNAREMQIDSDGHMVYLPPNNGSTWGPIWARRRFGLAYEQALLSSGRPGYWGDGALSQVLERLQQTRDGLMGLHANVGITFDLNAVRESRSRELNYFKAVVANLDSPPADHYPNGAPSGDSSNTASVADLRVFVDGKLRYSRLQFGRSDGEAAIHVALNSDDRFLTIVTTDAGADPVFDHVVLVDPVLEYEQPPVPQPDRA
ncbi:MAG: FecR domain-containing protein [Bythopirellula sp.]